MESTAGSPAKTSERRAGFLLFAVVLLSRFPFLAAGYGLDTDAWLLLEAGRSISTHGAYQVSRFPGYPIPEAVFALVWDAGPRIVNGLTAVCSAGAAVLFHGVLRRHGCRASFLGALGMSLVPIVFVHSVDAMDYLWALVPLLAAWRFALSRRFLLSGVFAGLAIGCRLTSALALVPLTVLCFEDVGARVSRRALRLWSGAAAVAALAYLAPFLEYGFGFLSAYPGEVAPTEALRQFGPGVWGPTGIAALALGLLGIAVAHDRGRARSRARTIACVLGILVFVASFLAMPHDAGYLIPVVPFTLVLFAQFLPSGWFGCLSLVLALAPFVDIGPNGVGEGPILRDRRERELQVRRIDTILRELEQRGETKAAVAAGPWLRIPTSFEYALRGPGDTEYLFFGFMTLEQMAQALERGYSVHTVRVGDLYYRDLAEAGASVITLPSK